MALNKKTKNLLIKIIIAFTVIAVAIAGVILYKKSANKIYSGPDGYGVYYNQQDSGKTIRFNKDKTFSYLVRFDENTEEVNNGTWSQTGDNIDLTFEGSENKVEFAKSKDGYIYKKDRIYRGVTSDKKLLNNIYLLDEEDGFSERLFFNSDGTVEIEKSGNSKLIHGTYTRVDDILIVRYKSRPDSDGKSVDITERYLVLENGITKEIYHKEPAENIAK